MQWPISHVYLQFHIPNYNAPSPTLCSVSHSQLQWPISHVYIVSHSYLQCSIYCVYVQLIFLTKHFIPHVSFQFHIPTCTGYDHKTFNSYLQILRMVPCSYELRPQTQDTLTEGIQWDASSILLSHARACVCVCVTRARAYGF